MDHSSPVVIARTAVLNVDQDPTVYVVEGQAVHRQHVEIGVSDGTYVEVLQGLKPGDLCVVVGNQTEAAHHHRVRPTPSGPRATVATPAAASR